MDDFFEHLRKSTDNGTKLPNWRGELYFEVSRLARRSFISSPTPEVDLRRVFLRFSFTVE